MIQLQLIDLTSPEKPVNVSSVPQRSPFRYPGGKTWLIPQIRKWLLAYDRKPTRFYEPFAGGGIVGLTVAFENLADEVTFVELDEDVASVWQIMLSNDNDWLANKIINFDLTKESAEFEINRPVSTTRERAFQTILKNRIFHGGILAPGSGLIKHGEGGKGIHSRWYPVTISKRIRNIGVIQDRIKFIHGDGLEFIKEHCFDSEPIFFIDPPYTAGGKKAGSRLYTHYKVDHELIFQNSANFVNNFLMTYDNSMEVQSLAQKFGFEIRPIAMNNTHHTEMNELLIAQDMSWFDKNVG